MLRVCILGFHKNDLDVGVFFDPWCGHKIIIILTWDSDLRFYYLLRLFGIQHQRECEAPPKTQCSNICAYKHASTARGRGMVGHRREASAAASRAVSFIRFFNAEILDLRYEYAFLSAINFCVRLTDYSYKLSRCCCSALPLVTASGSAAVSSAFYIEKLCAADHLPPEFWILCTT